MKKLLTLAALVGAASLSFGQGYVNFQNTSTTRVSTNGVSVGFAGGPVGTWYYALLAAPSTQNTIDASLTGWTEVATGVNTATTGRMNGNTTSDNLGVQIPGFGPTATADFAIVAWSGNLGSDYQTVINGRPTSLVTGAGVQGSANWAQGGWYGVSAVANDLALAPSTGPFNLVWGPAPGGVPGMTLNFYSVPEPTSLALVGLGAAAMMIFRRRK